MTNVVIPTFDMKKQKPVIFSNYKVNTHAYTQSHLHIYIYIYNFYILEYETLFFAIN